MRIIAGHAKGRPLAKPKHSGVRPTTDRVRESIFSILGDVDNEVIVDGFAGSGALGCEALSRGAAFAYFFDSSRDSIALVHDNIERVSGQEQSLVHAGPFERGVRAITHDIHIVFLDPPYHSGLVERALHTLSKTDVLRPTALIVIEQEIDEPELVLDAQHYILDDQRIYGRTRVSFVQCSPKEPVLSTPNDHSKQE